jgi:hypothetical protein
MQGEYGLLQWQLSGSPAVDWAACRPGDFEWWNARRLLADAAQEGSGQTLLNFDLVFVAVHPAVSEHENEDDEEDERDHGYSQQVLSPQHFSAAGSDA